MKIGIITVAGISSRFNYNLSDDKKVLKCLYHEENPKETLVYKIVEKLEDFDRIIIVGGYRFFDLCGYVQNHVPKGMKEKISIIKNDHYDDLSSGYSLYLGIREAFDNYSDIQEILFVEGDLDIDEESFSKVVHSQKNVLTFNREAIYSNKAVVVYQNENNDYKYLFNADHGLLTLKEPFKAIFNSGQTWKFKDMKILKIANNYFKNNMIEDTNLAIIQKYFDLVDNDEIELIGLNHWINCNTREDYKLIKEYWSK